MVAVEIIMPKAGMAMEEGKIIRWLKEVGDPVQYGEAVMEIETDKITMESEAFADGVLLAKLYEDGAVVPVTTVVGYIGKPGEKIPERAVPAPAGAPAQDPGAAQDAGALRAGPALQAQVAAVPASAGMVKATPYAKTLATQSGIDIGSIAGSGAGGVIKARDVQAAIAPLAAQAQAAKATPLAARQAAAYGIDVGAVRGTGYAGKVTSADLQGPAAPAADAAAPLAGMRNVIARRMLQSHLEIPPVTQVMKVYVDELLAMREKINIAQEQKITVNDLIIKACAKAVAEFPQVRTEVDMQAGQLITRSKVNIGVAVALDQGLIVPVIFDADKLPLSEISARMKDLAGRARAGGLSPDEYSGSTFTISNMGSMGIHEFTPIINQPNAAIMGVGCIDDELALVGGQVISRKYLKLSLTFDHRILDGVSAAVFQERVRQLLENPIAMLV